MRQPLKPAEVRLFGIVRAIAIEHECSATLRRAIRQRARTARRNIGLHGNKRRVSAFPAARSRFRERRVLPVA
jgi:hypothetical protein